MSARRPIRSNLRWLAAAHLAVKPIWFVFLLLSARFLGAEQFGLTMLAISFTSILMVIVEGGIDMHVVRTLSAHPDQYPRLVAHSGALKLLSGIVVAVAAGILSFVPQAVPFAKMLLVPAVLFTLFNALMLHARSVFRAFEIMQFEAISIVVEKVAVLVLCGATLLFRRDAASFLNAYAAAYGVACIYTVVELVRRVGLPRAPLALRSLWVDVLRPGLPFALMNLFTIVYFRSGTLILKYVTGSEELVGYYNAGYRLVESYMLFPTIVIAPLYPVLARRASEGAALSPLIAHAIRAVLVLSVLITLPLVAFSKDFTRLFYGAGFAPAAPAVGIVCLAMIPVSLNFVFGTLVAASGRQARANVWIILITILNVAVNVALIPRYGVLGAAAVTVATESVLALANIWIARDFVRWREVGLLAARLAAPAALGVVTAASVAGRVPFPVGPIVVTAVVLLGYVVLRVVTLEDFRILAGLRAGVAPAR